MKPLSLALVALVLATASALALPNIVIIYADDLGYGDLGCYGHPVIRTPHLDRMAAEGVRFTSFYSAAEVCTPSRAALLTGRLPVRSGMCHDQFRVLRSKSTGHLPHEEITLAEALKPRGYATACVGKWHLGQWANNPEGHPSKHGFDHFFGLPHSNDMDAVPGIAPKGAPGRPDQDPAWWSAPLYRDGELIKRPADQSTLTRRYTGEAVKFIRESKGAPFFLYFPHTFPHVPLFTSDRFKSSPAGLYGNVIEELDWSVGEVLGALRESGLAENTLVFFSSDNGPWLIQNQQGGTAGLLREGKGSTWEGGMRVPGIAWWPGKIKPGVNRDIACTMDLFTTCLKLAGADAPKDREIDGLDLTDTLLSGAPSPRKTMFFYRGQQLFAVRKGPWKMHLQTQAAYGQPKPEKHDPPLLFHLEMDPSERFDVAAEHGDVIADLQREVEAHRAGLKPAPSQLIETVALTPQEAVSGYKQMVKLTKEPKSVAAEFAGLCFWGADQQAIYASTRDHAFHFVNYFSNKPAAELEMGRQAGGWPSGTAFIKEKLESGGAGTKPDFKVTQAVAGMVRRPGAAKRASSWDFFYCAMGKGEDGAAKLTFAPKEDLATCAKCHDSAPHDGVFARWDQKFPMKSARDRAKK